MGFFSKKPDLSEQLSNELSNLKIALQTARDKLSSYEQLVASKTHQSPDLQISLYNNLAASGSHLEQQAYEDLKSKTNKKPLDFGHPLFSFLHSTASGIYQLFISTGVLTHGIAMASVIGKSPNDLNFYEKCGSGFYTGMLSGWNWLTGTLQSQASIYYCAALSYFTSSTALYTFAGLSIATAATYAGLSVYTNREKKAEKALDELVSHNVENIKSLTQSVNHYTSQLCELYDKALLEPANQAEFMPTHHLHQRRSMQQQKLSFPVTTPEELHQQNLPLQFKASRNTF